MLRLPRHRAPEVEIVAQGAGQHLVLGPHQVGILQVPLNPRGNLFVREAVVEHLLDFLAERGFQLVPVLGCVDRKRQELRAGVDRMKHQLGRDAVAEPFLLADSGGQPGIQEPAAEQIVGHCQGRCVLVAVVHWERLRRHEECVGLVGGFDLQVRRVDLHVRVPDSREGDG